MLARSLSQCRLFEIPLEVFELSGLLSLDVAENELSTLSPLIANFSQLQTLHCEENNLKQLPVRRAATPDRVFPSPAHCLAPN